MFNQEFYPGAKKAKPMPVWLTRIIGLFIPKLRYAITIFTYFTTHSEEGNPDEANKLLGAPATDLKDFLKLYGESGNRK